MTPQGQRGFISALSAEQSARAAEHVKDFVVITNLATKEFAWIAPVQAYTERAIKAVLAGISLVKLVTP